MSLSSIQNALKAVSALIMTFGVIVVRPESLRRTVKQEAADICGMP